MIQPQEAQKSQEEKGETELPAFVPLVHPVAKCFKDISPAKARRGMIQPQEAQKAQEEKGG
ncbi:MAG: hypothetical protein M0Q93_12680, partial [Terrimicrobiaceae bacterium]|nr:hypothetical protein [Terrimicrobiaceae bacterium]